MPPDPADSTSRWQGRSASSPHSAGSSPGLSTSTHSHRVWATACLLPCGCVRGATPDERLLARLAVEPPAGVVAGDDLLGMLEQALEPLVRPGARRRRGGSGRRASAGRCRPCPPGGRVPGVSSTSPSDSPCSSPSCSARCLRAGSLPVNVRPSASRTRHGSVTSAGVWRIRLARPSPDRLGAGHSAHCSPPAYAGSRAHSPGTSHGGMPSACTIRPAAWTVIVFASWPAEPPVPHVRRGGGESQRAAQRLVADPEHRREPFRSSARCALHQPSTSSRTIRLGIAEPCSIALSWRSV